MAHKRSLVLKGKTPNGTKVVGGIYAVYETHGIPLDVLLTNLASQKAIPCWVSLYLDMTKAGIKPGRAVSMLSSAVNDAYPHELRDVIVKRLKGLPDIPLEALEASVSTT